MHRSHLHRGDVLLSIVGTIGELSLVASPAPATCSCKLAILRPYDTSSEYLAVFLRSKHGRNQIERLTRGAVQKGLILEDMDQLWVPSVSDEFERLITAATFKARNLLDQSTRMQIEAEQAIADALDLADWTPPEPLTYEAASNKVLAAGRLDASYFAPRIQALLNLLSRDGRLIADVARLRRDKFRSADCTTFNYIEISDLDGTGTAGSATLPCQEAPSRATWHVKRDDIITSTVRPIRRLSAQITPEQNGFVCSSGFVVVEPLDIEPEVLLTFLRLPAICELLDIYASASMYPAITEHDVLGLPFPKLPEGVALPIAQSIRNARSAETRSAHLLDAAQRAVEIAIECGEDEAIAFLDAEREGG